MPKNCKDTKFRAYTDKFGEVFYFYKHYKIVSYKYHKNREVQRYYQVYYIVRGQKNWGDSEYYSSAMLSFKECLETVEEHIKKYPPLESVLKTAERVKAKNFTEIEEIV